MEVKMENKKQNKKPTAAQMERRLNMAIIHIDRTKDTKSVYFDDKGLRLIHTQDFAIVETGAHRHVFNSITANGYSRPWIYVGRFIDFALENDCTVKDGNGNMTRSYAKLMSILKEKEDQTEYNISFFVDLWLFNIWCPLFSIDDSEAGAFIVYEEYVRNIARNHFLFDEHKEDVTNLQYVKALNDFENELLKEHKESVILHALTDEERIKQEIDAMQEQELDNGTKQEDNG